MPMERDRYPSNWFEIALAVKQAANWTCQQCGRPCRQPGESVEDFALRLADESDRWTRELYEYVADEESGEWTYALHSQRFCLTTAHLDQNPGNNAASNLRALCPKCHLAHDRPFRTANGQRKRERAGQLNFFTMLSAKMRRANS